MVPSRSGRLPRGQHPSHNTSPQPQQQRRNPQTLSSLQTKTLANQTCRRESRRAHNPPITDNNFNMASTWKVAIRPSQMAHSRATFKPQTKKATQNTKSHPRKSQLSPNQKSQLKNIRKNQLGKTKSAQKAKSI